MNDNDDRKIKALDLKIAKALQIDVPPLVMPELPEIEADNVTTLPVRKRSLAPWWFAVAATVVLATSITVRMSGMFTTPESLVDQVLAHVDKEPDSLKVTDTPITDEHLVRAVPAKYAVFDRKQALITYAQPCTINGNEVPHLVIQGQYGPITILLMPEEELAEATPIDGENVSGIIFPVGDGSIAIIGAREEALEPIRKQVLGSVTWTT